MNTFTQKMFVYPPAHFHRGYCKLIQKLLAECRKLGMNYGLYDEGGLPSGSARGPETFIALWQYSGLFH